MIPSPDFALIGIIVSRPDSVEQLNAILHQYASYIIGRMGIPYKEAGVSLISVALDAPRDVISALSGKLGALEGVSAKTVAPKIAGRD
jgi:putative iron-only hydrogenase system regulator